MLSPAEILGPGGRIAARLDNYEARGEQLAMAEAVAAAIDSQQHLVVEAGTGRRQELRVPGPGHSGVGRLR